MAGYDSSEYTMKVDSSYVGKIIGRGGNKIRELQDDSGAQITVVREEDYDGKKIVEIRGDPDQIDRAKTLIEDCMRQDYGRSGGYNSRDRGGGYGNRNGGGGWGRRDDDRWGDQRRRNYDDSSPRETIYVESSEVGRIIGKGGSRIRDMEGESGCRIKVSRDGHGGQNSVDLIGSSSQIRRAKEMISDAGVELINGGGW